MKNIILLFVLFTIPKTFASDLFSETYNNENALQIERLSKDKNLANAIVKTLQLNLIQNAIDNDYKTGVISYETNKLIKTKNEVLTELQNSLDNFKKENKEFNSLEPSVRQDILEKATKKMTPDIKKCAYSVFSGCATFTGLEARFRFLSFLACGIASIVGDIAFAFAQPDIAAIWFADPASLWEQIRFETRMCFYVGRYNTNGQIAGCLIGAAAGVGNCILN